MHLAVEVLNQGLLYMWCRVAERILDRVWPYAVQVSPYSVAVAYIQVHALDAGTGHVYHIGVEKEVVAHANAFGVGGKACSHAGRALRAFVKRRANTVGEIFRHTCIRVDALAGEAAVYESEFTGVDITPRSVMILLSGACKSRQSQRKNC